MAATAHHVLTHPQIIWQVPSETRDITVEIFDENNKYVTAYTITNYITAKPGYKLRVTAKKRK